MTRKFEVEVTRYVRVEVDETKFTEEFMKEFRKYIDSSVETIEEHIEHLGWLYAAGHIDNNEFIEGYGEAKEMGIKFSEQGFGDDIDIKEV